MSNKTNFKRVALAVVAALGLGVLASGPSSAVIQVGSTMTVTAVNSSVKVSTETASATIAFAFTSLGATADSVSITAVQTGGPVGGPNASNEYFRAPVATDSSGVTALTRSGSGSRILTALVSETASNKAVSFTARFDVDRPTVAGTYTYTFYPSFGGTGNSTVTPPAPVTYTFTVVGQDRVIAKAGTSIIVSGKTADSKVHASDSTVIVSGLLSTAGASAQAANIMVVPTNAAGETVTQLTSGFSESMVATISGPGLLSTSSSVDGEALTTKTKSVNVLVGNYIHVHTDGSAGSSTITITNAAGTVTLGTEKVSFSGTAASIGLALANTVVATGTNEASILRVTIKDKDGNTLPSGSVFIHSSDTAIVANSASAVTATTGALGYAPIGVTLGTKAGKVKLKVANYSASATTLPTTPLVSNEVELLVGGTPATADFTVKSDTFRIGDKATIVLTVRDANKDLVADQTITGLLATGGFKTSRNVTAVTGENIADTVIAISSADYATGTYEVSFFLPQTAGELVISTTYGAGLPAAARVADSFTVIVLDPAQDAADAAVDAAQEATDAAIAATDAAILAQEAADEAASAATAAQETAQAAVDAVTALSAEVTKLVAQLATLQKLLNRVAKRVGVKL